MCITAISHSFRPRTNCKATKRYFQRYRCEPFSALGQTDLARVRVSGVRTAYEKFKESSESKGVRAHFRLDESCLLTIDRVGRKEMFDFEKINSI